MDRTSHKQKCGDRQFHICSSPSENDNFDSRPGQPLPSELRIPDPQSSDESFEGLQLQLTSSRSELVSCIAAAESHFRLQH